MTTKVNNIVFLVRDAGIDLDGMTAYCNMYYEEYGADINFYFIYFRYDYTKGQRNTIKFQNNDLIITNLFYDVLNPSDTIIISSRIWLFNDFFRTYPGIAVRYPVILEHHANILDFLKESKWLTGHFFPEHSRMNAVNAVKVFTKAEAFGVRKFFSGKILSIPNPSPNCTTQLNYNPNKVVFVGRLQEDQKNLTMLTKVAKRLKEKNENIEIHIYGDGRDRKIIEDIFDISVVHGYVENKHDIYKDACVYISTSYFEGMSIAMLESMAYGIPVISTKNCPATLEIITHGVNGYLYDLNQVDEYVDAINDLCTNKELRGEFSKNMISTSSNYRKEVVMNNYIKEMINCIEDNASLDSTKSMELALNYFSRCYLYKLAESEKLKKMVK